MSTCNKCGAEFELASWAKRHYECGTCRRARQATGRARRRAEGRAPKSIGEAALTYEQISAAFQYDGQRLIWRVRTGLARPGQPAGFVKSCGYVGVRFRETGLQAHRVVWMLAHGHWPAGDLDHINGIKTDNRIENLRLATNSQNGANRGRSRSSTSPYKGVVLLQNGTFQAQCGGKYLGVYPTAESAAQAYDREAIRRYGPFARPNFGSAPC